MIFDEILVRERKFFVKYFPKQANFFLKNTVQRAKNRQKKVVKKVLFFVFFGLWKWLRSRFCHELFLGQFTRATMCQKRTFIFSAFQKRSLLPWENTFTNFWDTPYVRKSEKSWDFEKWSSKLCRIFLQNYMFWAATFFFQVALENFL